MNLHCHLTCFVYIWKNIPACINKHTRQHQQTAVIPFIRQSIIGPSCPPYQIAIDKSGYHYMPDYKQTTSTKWKNTHRNNILWYNPLFSKNISTNNGDRFLTLVNKYFPKDHKLRKILNHNIIKISYSCMKSNGVTHDL